MWFKNLLVYRLTKPFSHTQEQLENALQAFSFKPCGSQDLSQLGWVSPLGKQGQTLSHSANNELLICVKKEEKILPATVVRDALQEKVEHQESEQQRALKKAEKQALKDDIVQQLLPRAFTRHAFTFAWVSPDGNFIAVDAASSRKAEELLGLLRKSLGSLPVVPLNLSTPADVTMTDWLNQGDLPKGFELGDEAELRSALEHGGIIRCKEQDLLSDEIAAHLAADKMVTKLALNYADNLSFVLGDDLALKRLKFADELLEENDDITSDDPLARFDADFTLLCAELRQFIPALIEALGGEQVTE
ncbi:recombination-associated protein RdgC [Celerinatantimonas yamalensis]|uniref:Recombination-associated protein RdgC n=1 Tax=Celerinatantimonas yamalensis TaxID=559956 RepID=A0ABW9G7A1_9GAMM